MQSRCYYLLDGNSIPRRLLKKISNCIMNFMQGPFCHLPFTSLEAPLSSSGINCPSLTSHSSAYDLKFISDLISSPPSMAWKVWTMQDLILFSTPNLSQEDLHLNPLLQKAYTKSSCLNNHLTAAFLSAQRLGLDLRSSFPSMQAKLLQPILYHPAIPVQFMKQSLCLTSHGITMVSHLYSLPHCIYCKKCIKKVNVLRHQLALTPWGMTLILPTCPHLLRSAFGLPCVTPQAAFVSLLPLSLFLLKVTKSVNRSFLGLVTHLPLMPDTTSPTPSGQFPLLTLTLSISGLMALLLITV